VPTVTVSVPTIEDIRDEYDEEFEVAFTASVADIYYESSTLGIAGATIVDDDAAPTLRLQRVDAIGNQTDLDGVFYDNTVPEYHGVVSFDVIFSHPSSKEVELTFGTQDGSATGIAGTAFDSTKHDEDFELFTGRTQPLSSDYISDAIDFVGGTIQVPLNNDWWHEGSEVFTINLGPVSNATLPTALAVTINDDVDDKPTALVPETMDVIENDPEDLVVRFYCRIRVCRRLLSITQPPTRRLFRVQP